MWVSDQRPVSRSLSRVPFRRSPCLGGSEQEAVRRHRHPRRLRLCAYLAWSWRTPLTTFGPESQFGVVRWLGTALAAAFTVVWLPLFPRVMATLAGMIAGPALFALVGYTFFGSHMQIYWPGSDGRGGRPSVSPFWERSCGCWARSA